MLNLDLILIIIRILIILTIEIKTTNFFLEDIFIYLSNLKNNFHKVNLIYKFRYEVEDLI